MLEIKTQVIEEINNQILFLTSTSSSDVKSALIDEKKTVSKFKEQKLEILSEMEALEEGFLLIKKK